MKPHCSSSAAKPGPYSLNGPDNTTSLGVRMEPVIVVSSSIDSERRTGDQPPALCQHAAPRPATRSCRPTLGPQGEHGAARSWPRSVYRFQRVARHRPLVDQGLRPHSLHLDYTVQLRARRHVLTQPRRAVLRSNHVAGSTEATVRSASTCFRSSIGGFGSASTKSMNTWASSRLRPMRSPSTRQPECPR